MKGTRSNPYKPLEGKHGAVGEGARLSRELPMHRVLLLLLLQVSVLVFARAWVNRISPLDWHRTGVSGVLPG